MTQKVSWPTRIDRLQRRSNQVLELMGTVAVTSEQRPVALLCSWNKRRFVMVRKACREVQRTCSNGAKFRTLLTSSAKKPADHGRTK